MVLEHHHEQSFLLNRELNELYISVAIRAFAFALINVFIPIYLFELGFSLKMILVFFAGYSLVRAAAKIPAVKFGARFGFKHMILFSVPLTLIAFLLFYALPGHPWLLWLIVFVYGIATSFYWVGYHFDFATSSNHKNRGMQVGFAKVAQIFGAAIAPFIGGVVLTFFGFHMLFIIGAVLLFCSAIPLFFSADSHEQVDVHFSHILHEQLSWESLSFVGFGIERGVLLFIWPIVLFSILGDVEQVGFVASLSLIASVVTTIFVGKFVNRNPRKFLRIGSILSSFGWAFRSFATSIGQLAIVDLFYGMSRVFVDVPFDVLSMDKATKTNKLRFIVFRGWVMHISRAVFLLALVPWSDTIIAILSGAGGVLLHFFL